MITRLRLYRKWRRFKVLSLAYPILLTALTWVGMWGIWWWATYG